MATLKTIKENTPSSYLTKLAVVESGNNPNAKAKTSSASGAFQFLESTWKGLNDKYKLGYTLNDRFDPVKSKKVADLLTKENENALKPVLGRELNDGERYLGHFLGTQGSKELLSTYLKNPNEKVGNVVSGGALKANKSIFINKDGSQKTVGDVYNWASKKMSIKPIYTDSKITYKEQPQETVTPTLNYFGISKETPTFASVPESVEEETTEKIDKEVAEVEQKTKEYNFLEELQKQDYSHLQPEQVAQQQTVPQVDFNQQFQQVSQFIDEPLVAQQGGSWQEKLANRTKKPTIAEIIAEGDARKTQQRVQADNTKVSNYNDARLFNPNVRNKTDKEIAQEREARIQASVEAQKNPYTKENWRQQLASETSATGDKLRVSLEPNFFDDYVNPAAMIGSMASNLGQAPLQAEQSDSVMPYVTSIGVPLFMGAVSGVGAKTTAQFTNNLLNPLAGTGELLKNTINPINIIKDISAKNRVLKIAKENKDFFNSEIGKERLRNIGINPSDLEYPSITFNKNGSGYFDKNINIDLKQIRDIEKEGLTSSPTSVYDHENAHWLQEQKIKNTDKYQNALLDYEKELDKYNEKTNWYKENNYIQGDPPQKPSIGSVSGDYKTNADYYLHEKFNTFDENNILSKIKEQGVKNPDDIRYHNALHFTGTQEPFAYVREFRRDLINKNYIKNIDDPITEETIKSFIKKEPKARMSSIIGNDNTLVKAVKNVINGIPAVAPIAGASYLATQEQEEPKKLQQGGEFSENELAFLSEISIKDNNGYWDKNNQGKVVEIEGNKISMENVDQDLIGIGIDKKGKKTEQKTMKAGKNYNFDKAIKVIEIPLFKK